MKLRLRHTALLLTLTAALLPGCSKSEPEPTPVPEPYYPEQEVVTPQPAPAQPAPEPVDPADSEPVPVEPEPVPAEAPTPVEPELVVPEEESYSLMERLDRAYTYRDPESEENYYIEFKIINDRLFAEVAAQMDTGSRFTYWMAELLPIDAQDLLSGDGKPCLLRSREFSGFSLDGAYWGEEEVISLSVAGEQLKYQKGEETYVLTPAETIEEIHDEADLRRYLHL